MAQAEITGLFQYLKWGVGSASAGLGLWTGGDLSTDPDMRSREGAGGTEVRRGGLCKFGGQADFYVSSTNQALVGYGFRASYPRGALQELVFDGGADQWGRTYSRSVITEGSLTYAQGEGLKCSINWGALLIAAGAGDTMPDETASDFEDYEFAALFNGSEYGILGMDIKWNNNITFKTNGDAKTTGQIRWPKYYTTGSEELTVDITTGRPIPEATLNLFGDDLTTNLTASLIGSNPTNTVNIALAGLAPGGPEGFGQVGNNDQAEWKYSFKGSRKSGSLTWGWS